jgi:hypothetical protein
LERRIIALKQRTASALETADLPAHAATHGELPGSIQQMDVGKDWIVQRGAQHSKRRDKKKEEFPGFMQNMLPANSFPQICVVSGNEYVGNSQLNLINNAQVLDTEGL